MKYAVSAVNYRKNTLSQVANYFIMICQNISFEDTVTKSSYIYTFLNQLQLKYLRKVTITIFLKSRNSIHGICYEGK